MALSSSSSSLLNGSISSSFAVSNSHHLKASWLYSDRQTLVPSTAESICFRRKSFVIVKPICAKLKSSDSVLPLASSSVASEVEDKIETKDYQKLAREFEGASSLEIMDKAFEKFGNDIAIAFSGAEYVVSIEYAKLTGRGLQGVQFGYWKAERRNC